MVGMRGIKLHQRWTGQKLMCLAQIAWLAVGIFTENLALVGQSAILFLYGLHVDEFWERTGYYD